MAYYTKQFAKKKAKLFSTKFKNSEDLRYKLVTKYKFCEKEY